MVSQAKNLDAFRMETAETDARTWDSLPGRDALPFSLGDAGAERLGPNASQTHTL